MATEDPGHPEAHPSTPVWPLPRTTGPASPGSVVTPVRRGEVTGFDDEQYEQFDWDSWQPGAIADDDLPGGDTDWDASVAVAFDNVGLRQSPDDISPSLDEPLPASGGAWPPATPISHEAVQVRVPRWAPFVTGLALALAMILTSAAVVSQTGRLGLTLAILTGQVPTSADAVVSAYLSAIARGDATKALSYLSTPQSDPLLLTDAVLTRSIEHSPITVLDVTPSASSFDGSERITATYRIGDQDVTTTFRTDFADGQWWISDDPGRIGLGSIRANGIPLIINGEEIPSTIDSVPAFPGTYDLATTSPYITFAAPSSIVVRSSDEAPVVGAVRLELTEAGRQQAFTVTTTVVAGCLAKTELQPEGCPQNIEPNRNEPPVAGSVKYTAVTETPLSLSATDLRSASVTVAYVATWRLDVKVYVDGIARDVSFSFAVDTQWRVTLSGATPTAVLVR